MPYGRSGVAIEGKVQQRNSVKSAKIGLPEEKQIVRQSPGYGIKVC